jgi:hypothetical protein
MNPVKPVVAVSLMIAIGVAVSALFGELEHKKQPSVSSSPVPLTAPNSTAIPEPAATDLTASPRVENGVAAMPTVQEPDSAQSEDTLSMVPGAIPGMMPMQVISPAIIKTVKSFASADGAKATAEHERKKLEQPASASTTLPAKDLQANGRTNADGDKSATTQRQSRAKRHLGDARRLAQKRRSEKWHV